MLFRFCFLKLLKNNFEEQFFKRRNKKKSCLIKLFRTKSLSARGWTVSKRSELSQQEIGTTAARDRNCSRVKSEPAQICAPEIGATRGHAGEIRTTISAICGCDSARQWLEVLEIEDDGGVSWDGKWRVGGWYGRWNCKVEHCLQPPFLMCDCKTEKREGQKTKKQNM